MTVSGLEQGQIQIHRPTPAPTPAPTARRVQTITPLWEIDFQMNSQWIAAD